ncbi:hypothetical protein RUM43_007555 [Polyplax serrata]|uniref:Uncharacterized protein n=1 Tax=Polyplax serrata TaxID=468196 RepID=A0AAN8Q668_POLSC
MSKIRVINSLETHQYEQEGETDLINQKTYSLPKINQAKQKCAVLSIVTNNSLVKNRLKFHCHFEEHKKKVEMKRKKLIQNLKKKYDISVDGFNDDVINEMIRRVEVIEKASLEKEKRNSEKTLRIVTKLLDEQKSKYRARKLSTSQWRRKSKSILLSTSTTFQGYPDEQIIRQEPGVNVREETEKTSEGQNNKTPVKIIRWTPTEKRSKSQFRNQGLPETVCSGNELPLETELSSFPRRSPRNLRSVPLEKGLECTPQRIVFEDYRRDQTYFQILRITNIALQTIHCRYLGIVVQNKQGHTGRFPIGVAVRDSVKLSPGLSCSTKIRLRSSDETKMLECFIVFETRRLAKPLENYFFFIPVACLPARAIVNLSPLKIRFPSLSWCTATGPSGSKLLQRILRIENTGGKECCCKIVKKILDVYSEEEDSMEEEGERSTPTVSNIDITRQPSQSSSTGNNWVGEGESSEQIYLLGWKEITQLIDDIFSELVDNVFATFRFTEKYHILIPPHSVKRIGITFIPEYKGFHQEMHSIQFENCDDLPEETIELTGNIKKLCLTAEPQVLDLKTCVINSEVCAGTFRVFNNGKGPTSVRVRLPRALQEHASLHPRRTIIQSYSNCEFSVRIYPR